MEVTVATGRCQHQELVRLARITRGPEIPAAMIPPPVPPCLGPGTMTRLHDRRRLVWPLANRRRSCPLNGCHTMEPTPCNVIGPVNRPTHPDDLAAIPYLFLQPTRSTSPPTIVNYLLTSQEMPAREVNYQLIAEDSTTGLHETRVTTPMEDSPEL
ncbi:hypothetical protein BDP81DRAFT_427120 [Colletotrichum phormii]|uniref:Uncharacterized protein n=1 Tax=Colletotrichum phormii TaxID=359342 RepID=A0AAI9ZSC4_9PEZI|nr:uncharacterized protein BDP81DRAFT_427120 [Colletotrichum phormii]KAK1637279.1 hypothetical protein BDP81DRAFT_427120 [Colletotrichum phormii]